MTVIEVAQALGAKGTEPTEEERLLFEAWMKGHCWVIGGAWTGVTYQASVEVDGYVETQAMLTRMLWAAWRDRAALATESGRVSVPREPGKAHDSWTPFKCPHCGSIYFGPKYRDIDGKWTHIGRYCKGLPSGFDRSYVPCPESYFELFAEAQR